MDPTTEEFRLLMEALKTNHARSPWAAEQGLKGWVASLTGEVREVAEAPSFEEKMGEMGDVLWCWISAMQAAEANAGTPGLTAKVIQEARLKLQRRKPWIFDGSPPPESAEAEALLYAASKAREQS